jgi:hypothetical protein
METKKYEFMRVYYTEDNSKYLDFIVWKNQWNEWQRKIYKECYLFQNLTNTSKSKLFEYMQEDVDFYFNTNKKDRDLEEEAYQEFLKEKGL